MEPDKLVAILDRDIQKQRKRLLRNDEYYEGEQPLRYMAPELQAEIGDRVTQLVINWPKLCTEAYENRSDIEGFRFAGNDSTDDELWKMWQANDGDEQAQLAHLESLICGRAFVIVGSGESDEDLPVMTVEHPLQMTVRRDPKTRKISMALKRWKDDDGVQNASLYLPDSTIQFIRKRGTDWTEIDRDDHQLGRPPVAALLNNGRLLRQLGRSEFHDIIPIADAANKMATDMMISGEFHAMPRRWAIGMTEADFVDEDGNKLSTFSTIAGRLWATDRKPSDVEYGQFTEASLEAFHATLKVLAQLAAQLMFLPQDYMSFTSDNPTSADALRSSESRLVKRCERKHTAWGGGWEEVQRLMLRFKHGGFDPKARSLETVWRDPSTPTIAQKADAVVKLRQAGILPTEFARQELGYTSEQRRRMAEEDAKEADISVLGSLAAQFRQPANANVGA